MIRRVLGCWRGRQASSLSSLLPTRSGKLAQHACGWQVHWPSLPADLILQESDSGACMMWLGMLPYISELMDARMQAQHMT